MLTFISGQIDFIFKISNTEAIVQTSFLCLFRKLRIYFSKILLFQMRWYFGALTFFYYCSSLWAKYVFLKSIWKLNFNNKTNCVLSDYQNSLLFKDVLERINLWRENLFVIQIDILPQICCLVIFKVVHICNHSIYLKVDYLRSDNWLLSKYSRWNMWWLVGDCIVLIMCLAMISYNIITGDTLSKVFQRIPGGKSVYLFYIVFHS